jgi:ABC-2 type transport system permease protein
MTRLLLAELLRLRSRRAVVVLVVLIGLVGAFILIGLAIESSRPPPSRQTLDDARRAYEEFIELCRTEPDSCHPDFEDQLTVEDFYDDPRFVLGQDAEAPKFAYGVLLVVLSMMIGATFVGSEWHHNAVGNQLLWEPRRVRVLVAKAAAAAGATSAGAFVLQLLFLGGLWLVAATRGVTSAPAGFLGDTMGDLARISLTVALVTVMGVAIASLTRSTAASVGILLAYAAVVERFLEAVRPHWRPWLPGNLAAALFVGEIEFSIPGEVVEVVTPGMGFSIVEKTITITAGRGALVLGIYAAILLGGAILLFRRRDVT